ncbi:MAG: hypothetical protein IJH12_04745 [Clostridia bacterium]|nr:hypothetical protein [Clostridia bacterium]
MGARAFQALYKMNSRLEEIEDIRRMIKDEENKLNGLKVKANNIIIIFITKRRYKSFKLQILMHFKKNFFDGGVFCEKINC